MRSSILSGLTLLVLLISFQVVATLSSFPNISPLPALFLCAILYLPSRWSWSTAILAWTVSIPITSLLQGYHPFEQVGAIATALLTLLGIGYLASRLPKRTATVFPTLGAAMAAAILFHLVTGLTAWVAYPLYPKTAEGLWQSWWSGPLGASLPSWAFLRNSMISNLVFSALFLSAYKLWIPSAGLGKSHALASH